MSQEPIQQGANQVASGDLIKLFATIKENVMRSLAVAKTATVQDVEMAYGGKTKRYKCVDAVNPNVTFFAYAMEMLTLKDKSAEKYDPVKGDMVVVLFTDEDYRYAYNQKIGGYSAFRQNTLATGDKHSTSYGIIIGKLI